MLPEHILCDVRQGVHVGVAVSLNSRDAGTVLFHRTIRFAAGVFSEIEKTATGFELSLSPLQTLVPAGIREGQSANRLMLFVDHERNLAKLDFIVYSHY
jgi:hypothetical protein